MDGEINEKAVKGRSVIGSLARVMREKCVHGGKEGSDEYHSPSNTDIWVGPRHGTRHSSRECVLWR